jgi:hypothetical protein
MNEITCRHFSCVLSWSYLSKALYSIYLRFVPVNQTPACSVSLSSPLIALDSRLSRFGPILAPHFARIMTTEG